MLESILEKKIEELEKEKFRMNIDAAVLTDIDKKIIEYRQMLSDLRKE